MRRLTVCIGPIAEAEALVILAIRMLLATPATGVLTVTGYQMHFSTAIAACGVASPAEERAGLGTPFPNQGSGSGVDDPQP